ncbi:hypothetical protein OPV22_022425 [Ensete ventricosum]|uniref:Uncharacterized protein n=1 Tax=Ensete ventricosum TaxID=4639 RepID=A0AAV8QNG2_ENSVE|nr:hypothetical protein OPV22_022425 [Ensete ventricosum]
MHSFISHLPRSHLVAFCLSQTTRRSNAPSTGTGSLCLIFEDALRRGGSDRDSRSSDFASRPPGVRCFRPSYGFHRPSEGLDELVLPDDVDLLNPPSELEKRMHKLKRFFQSTNSFFMLIPNSFHQDVKCQGCFNITMVFSHSQTVVGALSDAKAIEPLYFGVERLFDPPWTIFSMTASMSARGE